MDKRKIADMSDDEIRTEIKTIGLAVDADNSGHDPGILREVLRSLAEDYEPLLAG